jgi:predicted metalloprotease with PDZ domain
MGRKQFESLSREYTIRNRPNGPPSAMWYIGIQVTRAPRGIFVSGVAPCGSANQFGLEPGDYILDAGGCVVGDYQGSGLFDLEKLNKES